MNDESKQRLLAAFRADLKAMEDGSYVPPLPHPESMIMPGVSGADRSAATLRGWQTRRANLLLSWEER